MMANYYFLFSEILQLTAPAVQRLKQLQEEAQGSDEEDPSELEEQIG